MSRPMCSVLQRASNTIMRKAFPDYCGQLHLMQKFSLNEINCDPNKINSSFIKNSKTKLFANWLCFVKLCSKCGEFLYEEFLYCNRCSFLLCQNCYDKK